MKTSEEMVRDLFDRRERYVTEKKRKRKAALRVAVPAAACCLAAAVGVGVWLGGGTGTVPTTADVSKQTSAPAGTASENAATQTDSAGPYINPIHPLGIDTTAAGGDNAVYLAYYDMVSWRNKTGVHRALAEALDAAKADEKVAILCHPPIDYDFVHGGKTIAKHYKDFCEARLLVERMQTLLKLGDDLKYGEALYTGNAEGDTSTVTSYTQTQPSWDKNFYEETVESIGADLLDKYIVDGAFRKEALERDLAAAQKSTAAEDAYKAALAAFYEKRASELAGVTADPEHFGLIMEMTPDEFEAFDPGPEPNGWSYALPASGGEPTTEPAVITGD